jgi:hypothetical protein
MLMVYRIFTGAGFIWVRMNNGYTIYNMDVSKKCYTRIIPKKE